MIKKILSLALIFSSIITSAQSFTATYSFAATTTVSGTTDPTPSPTVTGITCGSFVAVGTPSANPNAGGRFSFVGWPTGSLTGTVSTDVYANMTGSINTGEYYEVALTPQSGYTMALNSIAFTVQRSGSGIRSYVVRSSADGFTNNLPAAVLTGTNLSVIGTNEFFWNFDAVSTAQNGSSINLGGASTNSLVSFRFYAWNSEQSSGTFSIDNVVFTGSVITATAPCTSPTITLLTSNSPICANEALNLESTVLGDAPFTYTWTGAGSFGSANSASTTVTGATSSDYILTVSNACGTETAMVTATVNALPTISVNSETICAGSSATLTVSGASTYTWSSTLDVNTDIVVTPTVSITQYTVTTSDINNCENSAIATVSVNALPTILVNSESICAGSTATLAAFGAATYTWSTLEVSSTITVTPTASITEYTVMATDDNNCENMAVATVTVNALPIISVNSESICSGSSATLTASGASTYTWSTLDVNSTIVVSPTVSVTEYTVFATDDNNCENMAIATVTVNTLPAVSLDLSSINFQCVTVNSVTLVGGSPASGDFSGNGVTLGDFSPSAVGVGTYTITYTYTDGNNCSNSASDNIVVDACTGIKSLSLESFNIYPNPNNGSLTIKSLVFPANVNVFDINGKQVISKSISSFETLIDLSNVVNGVYQLNITTEQHSFNYKIVINK